MSPVFFIVIIFVNPSHNFQTSHLLDFHLFLPLIFSKFRITSRILGMVQLFSRAKCKLFTRTEEKNYLLFKSGIFFILMDSWSKCTRLESYIKGIIFSGCGSTFANFSACTHFVRCYLVWLRNLELLTDTPEVCSP